MTTNFKPGKYRWLLSRLGMIFTIMLLMGITAVAAQSTGVITLTKPDASQYPIISTSFRVTDLSGHFVKDLKADDLQLLENNRIVTVNSLELGQEGVRFNVAFNEGPTLANRYSDFSRFDLVKKALLDWALTHTSDTPDEFKAFTNKGILSMDPTDPENWVSTIEGYKPELKKASPGLTSFTNAMDALLGTGTKSTKTAAILFITPLPTAQQFPGIKDLITRARENNIRVFIWLVGPKEYATVPNAQLLQQYAEQTGGAFFLFTGVEKLPVLTELLDPMSYVYQLTYKTEINTSGNYPLILKIQKDNLYLESGAQSFSLNIAPPNPIFLSPPVEILRGWTETKKLSDAVLTPGSAELKLMIEFPDGLPRDLVYSRLFVDNKLADENTAEPFDLFTLDLSTYTSSGTHTLKAVVEDSMGLKSETIEIPVEIKVAEQPMTGIQKIVSRINVINGIIGSIIILLALGGFITLFRLGKRRVRKIRKSLSNDPVTEPVSINGDYTLSSVTQEEPSKWPVIHGVGLASARLIHKTNGEKEDVQTPEIPLGSEEVTIGSERKKVDVVLIHPTISPVHARIFKDMNGDYRVADSGSSTGTWVNYAPVSSHGARLEHGDLVQFGRLAYVFELRGAAAKRVQVLPYHED